MDDFKVNTLEAFGHFLIHEEIEDGKETALGLYLLSGRNDVPALRLMSQRFILNNLKDFNLEEVFDVFLAIDRPLVVNGFFKNYLN